MNYKKQLTSIGIPMSVNMAVYCSSSLVKNIKELKDKLIAEHNYGVNAGVWVFLDEIKAKILKFKITKEIMEENENEAKS